MTHFFVWRHKSIRNCGRSYSRRQKQSSNKSFIVKKKLLKCLDCNYIKLLKTRILTCQRWCRYKKTEWHICTAPNRDDEDRHFTATLIPINMLMGNLKTNNERRTTFHTGLSFVLLYSERQAKIKLLFWTISNALSLLVAFDWSPI